MLQLASERLISDVFRCLLETFRSSSAILVLLVYLVSAKTREQRAAFCLSLPAVNQLEPMQSVENKRWSDPSGLGSLRIVLQDIFWCCAFCDIYFSGKLPVACQLSSIVG